MIRKDFREDHFALVYSSTGVETLCNPVFSFEENKSSRNLKNNSAKCNDPENHIKISGWFRNCSNFIKDSDFESLQSFPSFFFQKTEVSFGDFWFSWIIMILCSRSRSNRQTDTHTHTHTHTDTHTRAKHIHTYTPTKKSLS